MIQKAEKYIEVFKVTLHEYFIYRLSFIVWRFSVVLNIILTFFLWNALYANKPTIFHYTKEQMLTYILFSSIIATFVLSSRTGDLAAEILNGTVINYLTKPMSFFKYILAKEAANKYINFIFGLTEIILMIIIFHPPIFIQTHISAYIFCAIAIVFSIAVSFFLSFSISLVAFWSNEIWAPRFMYVVLTSVLAGTLFPLDILPKPVYDFLLFTPFPYLLYLPSKIYLNGMKSEFMQPLVMNALWVGILFFFTRYIWRKGLKEFSFYGR